MHKYSTILLTFLFILTASPVAAANDLYYGHIQEVQEDKVLITYNSPAGDVKFICNTESLACDKTEVLSLLPSVLQSSSAVISPSGDKGAVALPLAGLPVSIYKLYSIDNNNAQETGFAVFPAAVTGVKFSRDGNFLVGYSNTGFIARYNLGTQKTEAAILPTGSYRLLNVSPDGRFVSLYSDIAEQHTMYDFSTKTHLIIPSKIASVMEFSDTKPQAAFLTYGDGGTHELDVVNLNDFPHVPEVTGQSIDKALTVTDYLFYNGDLFYIGNEKSPLTWSLIRYHDGEKEFVSDTASYNEYMQTVAGKLAYYQIDGQITNLYLYGPDESSTKVSAVTSSPTADLDRTEVKLAGVNSAILSPKDSVNDTLPVFIWMHGGPQRQTSLTYHPYLSYAVYDQILERLSTAGARIVKVDYTGSWGYGKDYVDALKGKIGQAEITDIENVVEAVTDIYPTSEIYLIGNSYGGYMALKASVENPDLYDGAISINGVSDWLSLIQDIPSSPFSTQFGGSLNDTTRPLYLAASVYTKTINLDKDPVLVAYATNDHTVPPNQSTRFIAFAKALNKNVIDLPLEGEDHVLKQRSSLDNLCQAIADVADLDVQCK